MNSEIGLRTVRTELVEVQILVLSDSGVVCFVRCKKSCSVRKFTALPFDKLRANGSFCERFNQLFAGIDLRISARAFVLFACAMVIVAAFTACAKSESAAALYVVEAKPWREIVRARGEVVSAKITPLNVPGQGFEQRQVLQLLSDGARVKKGELVATFEARSTAKELSVAELELMRNALIRAGVSEAGVVNAAQLGTEIAQTTGELELSERYANAANAGISKNELLDKLVDLGYLHEKRGTLNWRESQLEKKAAVELSVTDAQRATQVRHLTP